MYTDAVTEYILNCLFAFVFNGSAYALLLQVFDTISHLALITSNFTICIRSGRLVITF